jgi:hypothetical protein
MRRLVLPLLMAATLAACGSDEGTPASSGSSQLAQLVVRVDDDGAKGSAAARELQLTCAAPTDSKACGAAAGVSAADLRETAPNKACTQLYGGPEEASIKGTIRGDQVDATFKRTDGCEIERWERVKPLLSEVH